MIRLIALDLDGTLLDSRGRIPAANLDAIREALRAGIHVVVATGRTYHFASLVTNQLPREVVLIVNNGAAVKTADGRRLMARPLARETAAAVQERLQVLQAEFDAQAERLRADSDPALAEIVRLTIRPRKTDITVTEVALAWVG